MSTPPPPFRPALLAPRHWPAWLGLGLIALAARLPRRWLMGIAGRAGPLLARLFPRRARVARRNLALCFPELDEAQRASLLAASLRDSGRMLAEFTLAWFGSQGAIARIPVHVEGLAHLEDARAAGSGVLLLGAHFSHLEICARLLARHARFAGMYRRHADAAFEWAVRRARARYTAAMFHKRELRPSVRHLRAGGVLWYAPDQDVRGRDAVFAPFFGIQASTVTATHHLARLGDARVIPFFHRRLPDGSYAIRLEAPLADFPGADAQADTIRINAVIERMVREAPTQYLWLHKRFKTRPPGMPDPYASNATGGKPCRS